MLITPDELAAIVRAALEQVLDEQQQDPAPLLLDRNGIAKRLGLSTRTVDRCRKAGMPSVTIGDSPRFEPGECLAWLRENGQGHTRRE